VFEKTKRALEDFFLGGGFLDLSYQILPFKVQSFLDIFNYSVT